MSLTLPNLAPRSAFELSFNFQKLEKRLLFFKTKKKEILTQVRSSSCVCVWVEGRGDSAEY